MPITQEMAWYRGEAYSITDTVRNTAGTAVAITGWALAFTVRSDFDSDTVLLSKTTGSGITITSGSGGVMTITITAANTLALAAGEYVYDVQRTDSGSEALLTIGTLRVKPAVRQ